MADAMTVSGPVTIRENARARVAYDLMTTIANHEKGKDRDRAYWYQIYRECLRVVNGNVPEG